MSDAPPPYPGIDPNLMAYQTHMNGHGAAAAAAAGPYPGQGSAAGACMITLMLR